MSCVNNKDFGKLYLEGSWVPDVCLHSIFTVLLYNLPLPIPKKGNAKGCSNYRTTALISHASKVILKILQARFHQYVNRELPDTQLPGSVVAEFSVHAKFYSKACRLTSDK